MEGRQSRRSACLNTVSGVPTPVGQTPATGSAAPRQWRAGVDGGQDRAGSTQRPRLRKNGSAKTAGKPVRDRSRTAVVEQLARAPALLDPERLASGAGSLLRHGVHYAGQLASIFTGGSPIQPEKGDRRFADPTFTDHPIDYRVMQAYLALCAEGTPR
jgi:hypothetical protein